jgi:hypothetical protein
MAPRGRFALAHNRPPCDSMIERQIDRPSPKEASSAKLRCPLVAVIWLSSNGHIRLARLALRHFYHALRANG